MSGGPIRVIRRHCLACCAGSAKEVELCQAEDCHLYPYRFGMRPGTAKKKGKKVS